MFRTIGSLWRDEAGSPLVEGAIIIPVLFLFLFGLFEFALYFYQQQLVEMGTRDAARYMARAPLVPGVSEDPCVQHDASGTLFVDHAANVAVYGNVSGSGTPRVYGWTTADVTISCPASPSGTYADGETTMTIISVTTTVTGRTIGSLGLIGLVRPPLSASHQERWIGDSSGII